MKFNLFKDNVVVADKTILDAWIKQGFLEGIEEGEKLNLAKSFHSLAELLNDTPGEYDHWENIGFPLLRRLYCGYDIETATGTKAECYGEVIDAKQLIGLARALSMRELFSMAENNYKIGCQHGINALHYLCKHSCHHGLDRSLDDFLKWYYSDAGIEAVRAYNSDNIYQFDMEAELACVFTWFLGNRLRLERNISNTKDSALNEDFAIKDRWDKLGFLLNCRTDETAMAVAKSCHNIEAYYLDHEQEAKAWGCWLMSLVTLIVNGQPESNGHGYYIRRSGGVYKTITADIFNDAVNNIKLNEIFATAIKNIKVEDESATMLQHCVNNLYALVSNACPQNLHCTLYEFMQWATSHIDEISTHMQKHYILSHDVFGDIIHCYAWIIAYSIKNSPIYLVLK